MCVVLSIMQGATSSIILLVSYSNRHAEICTSKALFPIESIIIFFKSSNSEFKYWSSVGVRLFVVWSCLLF